MNLKELKQRARSEGVVGFSKMKKAELEAALEKALGVNLQKPKSFPAVRKVFPEKVAAVVDLSFDSLNSWFQGMKKKVNLNLKEKAREKLLKLNAKIKELLEKVVVKKRFLGHHQKFQKVHKIPFPPAQIQQNSSKLIHLC